MPMLNNLNWLAQRPAILIALGALLTAAFVIVMFPARALEVELSVAGPAMCYESDDGSDAARCIARP